MKKGFIKRCLSVVISAVLCISAFFSVNITAYAKENTNENKTEPRKVDCFELEFFLSDSGISVLNNVKYSLKSGI